jgi:type IV secretion system protein VirB11
MWLATSTFRGCTVLPQNNTTQKPLDRSTSLRELLRPLAPFLGDDGVTEVAINRPGEVWTERGSLWRYHALPSVTLEVLRSMAITAARFASQDISENKPLLSATLPEGERLQVVLPPACEAGTVSLTIRKPAKTNRSLSDYEGQGFFQHIRPKTKGPTPNDEKLIQLHRQKAYGEFFRLAVRSQKVIVVAGETGSGKTTLMKALMEEIPSEERILTIEDVPELFLKNHPNHVHLFYPSEAKEEENAPVTAASLLRSCLRMKPTRILLAELRGGETFDFLNVAASGHGGTITSCHAGSVELTFERLALMVLQNRQGRMLPYEVIRRLLNQVIDVVVHVHNDIHQGLGRHITELWFDPSTKQEAQ